MSIQILAEKGKREEVLEAAVTKHFKNCFHQTLFHRFRRLR